MLETSDDANISVTEENSDNEDYFRDVSYNSDVVNEPMSLTRRVN